MMGEHLFDPAPYTRVFDPTRPCLDCGVATTPHAGRRERPTSGTWEWYIVHDHVWQAAGAGNGYLCIGCLERRLDRRLVPQDFPDLEINEPSSLDSPRLRARSRSSAS